MQKLAVSPREASCLLGINKAHVYRAIAEGALVARRIGCHSIIWRDDLESWFRSRPATKSSTGASHDC
jgi:excisionase family DNA binding protein